MQTLRQDLGYALRLARRRPGFTLMTVLVLAIGAGGTTAIFSFVNALLLRPLPVPDSHRLVRVFGATDERPYDVLSYPNAIDLGARATTLQSLAIHQQTFAAHGLAEATETAAVELVSGNYFSTYGIGIALGRPLRPEDDDIDAAQQVAVISDRWWRTRYAESSAVLGSVLHLNGAPFTVVGVAPPAFRGSYDALGTDLWVPLGTQHVVRPRGLPLTRRGWGWLNATARLADGATAAQAHAELDTIASALAREHPDSSRGLAVNVVAAMAVPESMAAVLQRILSFAAIVVLLAVAAACANAANAQLATVISRQREIAVRLAMGATRRRVLRQWLTESVALAAAATVFGLVIAVWARDAFDLLRPPHADLANLRPDLALDWRVLAFWTALTALVTVLFGGVPAWRAARVDAAAPLKEDGNTLAGSRRRSVAQSGLVVVQVAVSLALLASAGSLVRSLDVARSFDLGFDVRNLLVAHAETSGLAYSDARTRAYYRETAERLRALPGVRDVTFAAVLPLGGSRESRGIVIDGHRSRSGSPFISTATNVVATNYFEVMGIPIVRGRGFVAADGGDAAAPVAVINETMAERYWPGGNAVGQRVSLGEQTPSVEIVGVARDIVHYEIGEAPMPYFYMPLGPVVMGGLTFTLRTAADDGALPQLLRRELRASDPRIRVPFAMTFEDARAVPLYPSRAMAAVSGAFGALALILTGIGLYGVVMYAVSQRTREFAVRLALGATPSDILGGVVRHGVVLAAAGLAVGIAGAMALAQLLRGFVIGVSAVDSTSLAVWCAVLLAIAAAASYVPARRATRIDPAAVLGGRG